MAAETQEYQLSIKVGEEITGVVRKTHYLPAVQILPFTSDVKLTNNQKSNWVTSEPDRPELKSAYGDTPALVSDGDGIGHFDIKFQGPIPEPDRTVTWFAIQTLSVPSKLLIVVYCFYGN